MSRLLHAVTPLIITFDERLNLPEKLEKLRWAQRIVVIDSGSMDGTLEILSRYPQVEVVHRAFDTFASQCNFGLSQVRTEWVLSLDADYELSDAFVAELRELSDTRDVNGYRARFVYRIYGRSLRGTLYPPRTVLHRVVGSRYVDQGHGHTLAISGETRTLRGVIYHDDRKRLSRWLRSQQRYAALEADYLANTPRERLSRSDRIRFMAWPAPVLVFLYVLIVKGCVLDGWAGWYYALQRLLAESMIALELIDRRLRSADQD